MNISDKEKEQLYEEFKERMIAEGAVNTKSASYKNQNNLKPARDHFKFRTESLRQDFEGYIWMNSGLNWPDWEFIKKLVCHTYGVSTASGISDALLEEVNSLAIEVMDKVFEVNEKTLQRTKDKMEENLASLKGGDHHEYKQD